MALDEGDAAAEEEAGSQVVGLEDEEEAEESSQPVSHPRHQRGTPVIAEDSDEVEDLFTAEAEEEPAAERGPAKSKAAPAGWVRRALGRPQHQLTRHATVRYYSQMNPPRTYPLLVVIAEEALRQIQQRDVGQRTGGPFTVAEGSVVEVEPLLPGCDCYPPRERVRVGNGQATASFWVVPRVLGPVCGARVLLRQKGRRLCEVVLDARVVNPTLTTVMGVASLVLPVGSSLPRHYHLDLESQLAEGFVSYAGFARQVLLTPSPAALALGLLALTGLTYLWLRPRRRDQFWDLGQDRTPPPGPGLGRRLCGAADGAAKVAVIGGLLGLGFGLVLVAVLAAFTPDKAFSWATFLLALLGAVGAAVGALAGAADRLAAAARSDSARDGYGCGVRAGRGPTRVAGHACSRGATARYHHV